MALFCRKISLEIFPQLARRHQSALLKLLLRSEWTTGALEIVNDRAYRLGIGWRGNIFSQRGHEALSAARDPEAGPCVLVPLTAINVEYHKRSDADGANVRHGAQQIERSLQMVLKRASQNYSQYEREKHEKITKSTVFLKHYRINLELPRHVCAVRNDLESSHKCPTTVLAATQSRDLKCGHAG